MIRFVVFLLLLTACSRGPEEIREEGQSVMRGLVKEFKGVKSRDELMEKEERIKVLFDKFVKVLVEAKIYLEKHDEALEFKWKDHELSDELKAEINRLYRIEGCKEIIEKCEREALTRQKEALEVRFPL